MWRPVGLPCTLFHIHTYLHTSAGVCPRTRYLLYTGRLLIGIWYNRWCSIQLLLVGQGWGCWWWWRQTGLGTSVLGLLVTREGCTTANAVSVLTICPISDNDRSTVVSAMYDNGCMSRVFIVWYGAQGEQIDDWDGFRVETSRNMLTYFEEARTTPALFDLRHKDACAKFEIQKFRGVSKRVDDIIQEWGILYRIFKLP